MGIASGTSASHSFGCDRIYYGVLGGGGGGSAYCPGEVGWGYLPANNALVYGYNRHAHEIAHSLGFDHAAFCTATTGGSCLVALTYNSDALGNATLGPMLSGEDSIVYGLDTRTGTPRVIDPNNTFAMMSYCGGTAPITRRWVAKVTYEPLHTRINDVFLGPAPDEAGPGEFLVVGGTIDLIEPSVMFQPLVTAEFPMGPPLPEQGPYTLQLLDVADSVLAEFSFSPQEVYPDQGAGDGGPVEGDPPGVGQFIITVPSDPAITRARVLLGLEIIGEVAASPSAPTVTVTFPNGGEVLDGEVMLNWSASDVDGDQLSSIVQYSPDGGSSWTTLVVQWPHLSYVADFDMLPGTASGLIRVYVSDGFNSAVDISDMFFVTDHAPTVSIISPEQGDEFSGVQTIFLSADADDVEDGMLPDSSVVWLSDIDGVLGVGADLEIIATDLTEDNHTITVTVTDSADNQVSASVDIAVEVIFEPMDTDGDGVPDTDDNCPDDPNPDQGDADGDGAGDECDPCPFDPDDDADGDGICGDADACPGSDISDTVVIDGCDSGVANLLFDDGCTMADLIAECAANASNHGGFVSCVAQLTNGWKQEGLISGQEKGAIQSCAAQSRIPGDLDGDGVVGVTDFMSLLAMWGPCSAPPDPCPADLDGDAVVGVADMLALIANWG